VQKKYLELLGIPPELYPHHSPWLKRVGIGATLLRALNKKFPGVSLQANSEIYARFQYRKNGLWTPLTRLERLVLAFWATYLIN